MRYALLLAFAWSYEVFNSLNVSALHICRLHAVMTGNTGKPLMLLLHGFPELSSMWEHQMNEFREDFNVTAIDMRGYGRSDRPTVTVIYSNVLQHVGDNRCHRQHYLKLFARLPTRQVRQPDKLW